MPRRRKPADDESVEHMLDAAREFAGDTEASTPEELAAIAEMEAKLPRPTRIEIEDIARRLAKRGSRS